MAVKFEKRGEGKFFLDVKGYVCPHPQLYTKKALEKMKSGDLLEVVFDNPTSSETISAMCEQAGNKIVEKNFEKGVFRWVIKKA